MPKQFFRLRKKNIAFLPFGLLSLVAVVFIQACTFIDGIPVTGSICTDNMILSEPGDCTIPSEDKNAPRVETIKETGEEMFSWNSVEGAVSYTVERSTAKNGTYFTVKEIRDATNMPISQLRITSVTYHYRVRACKNEGCTNSVDSASIEVKPVRVANLSLAGNMLKWDHIYGATSYQLYRSTSNSGKYTKHQSGNPITDNQYDLYAARFKTSNYYYKIVACKDDSSAAMSDNCTAMSDTYTEVVSVKVSALSQNDYELTWDNVEGVSYQVQKKKGTSAKYVDFGRAITAQGNKASLSVDDAYAFYRVRSCTLRVSSGDQACSEYSARVENSGPLSIICTEERHEPGTKAELKILITAEIKEQGNEAYLNCIDTSAIIDMSELFKGTSFNGDISKWDVSNVTNMSYMFNGAGAFNQDIGGWVVSKVTNMSQMFSYAKAFNQDLSNWKVDKVINMGWMFWHAKKFDQDLNAWENKVAQVTDVSDMFWDSGLAGNEPQWYKEKASEGSREAI